MSPKRKEQTHPRYVRFTDSEWKGVCALAEKQDRDYSEIVRKAVRLHLAGGADALAKAEAAQAEPTDEVRAGAWVLTLEEDDQIRLYWIGQALRENRPAPSGLWFHGKRKG